jgi:4-hydroxy-L-threonine phosphate dehydrogenase PdxA
MPDTSNKPLIAAMIGDPAGIGPEVCVKALACGELDDLCDSLLIGETAAVQRAAQVCGVMREVHRVDTPEAARGQAFIGVLDPGDLAPADYTVGKPSAAAGRAVVNWMSLGQQLGQRGQIDGLVLAPVDSASLKLGGLVQDIDELQPPDTHMLRLNGGLRVVPISEHIRLRDVAATVKQATVLELIRRLDSQLKRWGMAAPRIAVAGLNPHAMFEEERDEIAPAIAQARADGIDASGPVSPDAVFRLALEGRHDAVVTMYHDQGQIAVKTAAFAGACTIYMGLPYVMLNVPHGSAFDIAGRGTAQHDSLLAGLRTAAMLARGTAFLKQ